MYHACCAARRLTLPSGTMMQPQLTPSSMRSAIK
jgi:hypothetical protein